MIKSMFSSALRVAVIAGVVIPLGFVAFRVAKNNRVVQEVSIGSTSLQGSQDGDGTRFLSIYPRTRYGLSLSLSSLRPLAAQAQMRGTELVIGVSINGDARAYPINLLSRHEIVNDVAGNRPIAVTWWPLCFSGIVYDRRSDDRKHTFWVRGKLIMNALVMYDHQTNTLWGHFTGDAVQGPLVGTKLEILPAMQTPWGRWKELHPNTVALDKEGAYRSDSYNGYYANDIAGVFWGTHTDDRRTSKQSVLGVLIDGVPKAYPHINLYDNPVLNDSLTGKDLVVTFDAGSLTVGTFNRTAAGRSLTFRPAETPESVSPLMVDDQTGSLWRMLTGEAVEGELKGTVLEQIPSNYSFWLAWKDWHPTTHSWSATICLHSSLPTLHPRLTAGALDDRTIPGGSIARRLSQPEAPYAVQLFLPQSAGEGLGLIVVDMNMNIPFPVSSERLGWGCLCEGRSH